MSLNWELTDIENYQELCWKSVPEDYEEQYADTIRHNADGSRDKMNAITTAIIMHSMVIGFTNLTEKNLDDIAVRFELYQDVVGPLLRQWKHGKSLPVRITWKDLRQHVGLGTNASPLSWTKFMKMIRRRLDERIARVRKETERKAVVHSGVGT